MTTKEDEVIAIIRGGLDGKSVTDFIRKSLKSNPEKIEDLAEKVQKMPGFESNHLSKIRIFMARVSKELGIEQMSIRKQDGRYRVVIANRVNSDAESTIMEIMRTVEKAKKLSQQEKISLISRIEKVLEIKRP